MKQECKNCNTEFIDRSRSKTAIYCSNNCKDSGWYKDNKKHALATSRFYESLNKEVIKERKRNYTVNRRKTDLNFKLACNLRARLSRALKGNFKKSSLSEYLGCRIDFLKQHLESKFLPNMTWTNYGQWHIDHIKPLSAFNLSDPDQLKKACHYTNLQPLWAKDNLSKGNKYV